jgi:hypothetical protein
MMEQNQTGFSADKRADNDNRKAQTSETPVKMTPTKPKQESLGQRWNAVQLSKTAILWLSVAVIAGTMLVGFSWGGWVTGSSAQKTASTQASTAVVQRLGTICVAQFQQDGAKTAKLAELKATSSYQQGTYVKEQGWATMPGDEQADSKVATECAKLLTKLE